ncbi:MAG: sigma-54-dependent transcriptional regulator [Nitrospirales bacterium]
MRTTIYVTDDDHAVRSAITRRLERRNHLVQGFDSGEALIPALDHDTPDIILLDLKMSGMTGIETLKQVRAKAPEALVVLLTAYGTVENAVEAMKIGAYDFLIKSVDLSGIEPVVNRAIELLTLRRRMNFQAENSNGRFALKHLIAESPRMAELVAQIMEMTHNQKTTVLLQGETGTGKEFIARVLHHNGPRNQAPFVGVNCTAIPQELFESELFGYERGAFTGANQRKLGLCEQAEGGTLFLDEIGDMNIAMQAKLLRVLQERSVKRLGGRDDIDVDFRLIAATNHDLRLQVAQGNFRQDLYFRLNVVSLELPPLRHRAEDIIPLSFRSIGHHAKEMGKEIIDITQEARTLLEQYDYPGNIRELENILERAVIFSKDKTLAAGNLPKELHESSDRVATTQKTLDEQVVRINMKIGTHSLADIESAIIDEVMHLSETNKSLAAKHLGITRFALDRRLKKSQDS